MKTTLTEIRELIDKLAEQIQVPPYLLPKYDYRLEGPHIEIDRKGLLYYFETERGKEYSRYLAKDVDDLLYKVFQSATSMMASNYEAKNRVKGQDFRRVKFEEQERLLGVLNEKWPERRIIEIEKILKEHPFDDNQDERMDYYRQLVKTGQHLGNELVIANEKYPPINKFDE